MIQPVTLLRQAVTSKTAYTLTTPQNTPTTDITQAASFTHNNHTIPLTSPSGYKHYKLISILYFLLQNGDYKHYIDNCISAAARAGTDIEAVGFVDRKDLLDYLTGVSGTSSFIEVGEEEKMTPEERVAAVKADLVKVKFIVGFERCIYDRNSMMRSTKSFQNIQKTGYTIFTSKPPSKKPPSKRPKTTDSRPPIIIIPAGMQSPITLYNVQLFLESSTWTPSVKTDSKPTSVEIKHKGKIYQIVDNVDRFDARDWERVVAVFTNGSEWQFRGWKWKSPVEIFNNGKTKNPTRYFMLVSIVCGFAVKYHDEPVKEAVKGWNVKILNIHLVQRYLDGQTVHDFWRVLDEFVGKKVQ